VPEASQVSTERGWLPYYLPHAHDNAGFPFKVASAEAYPGDPTVDVYCIRGPIVFDFHDSWEGSRLKVCSGCWVAWDGRYVLHDTPLTHSNAMMVTTLSNMAAREMRRAPFHHACSYGYTTCVAADQVRLQEVHALRVEGSQAAGISSSGRIGERTNACSKRRCGAAVVGCEVLELHRVPII
jgi:hypothetical protein